MKITIEHHDLYYFTFDNIIYKSQTEWFFPSLKLIYLISILDEKNINELCLTR